MSRDDLRKEQIVVIVVEPEDKEKNQKPIELTYKLKEMPAEDAFDYLPVLGEIFGLSLFSILSNMSPDEKMDKSIIFSEGFKDAIQGFFTAWRTNKKDIKQLLNVILQDAKQIVEIPNNKPHEQSISLEIFSASQLPIIAKLFFAGLQLNYGNFLQEGKNVIDILAEPAQQTGATNNSAE